jgi:hypothetical protein
MFVAKIKILLDGPFVHFHPILMESVDEFSVKGWPEDFEIVAPLRPAQKDEVIPVDLSDACHDLAIQRLQFWVQGVGIKIVRNRLVKQIVADDCGLISISRGYLAPYVYGQVLALDAFKQKRIAPTIIDVVAGLSARRTVHIKNYVEIFTLAPGYNIVQEPIAFAFQLSRFSLRHKQPITERNTNRIEPALFYEPDIFWRDVILMIRLPKNAAPPLHRPVDLLLC